MNPVDSSNIIMIDQAKKKVIGFIREVSLTITDVRIFINLIIIETLRVVLLVRID